MNSIDACLVRPVVVAALLMATDVAFAAPDEVTSQCLAAYEDGQRYRKAGAFVQAKDAFAFCGGEVCPRALHGDCQQWLSEVEVATPTSVFRVVTVDGRELRGVELTVDGGSTTRLDGRAQAFDPGEHHLRFQLDGYQPLERNFTFSEGEKLVAREIVLEAVHTAPASVEGQRDPGFVSVDEGTSKSLVPVWIGVGIGAIGVAGFSYFALEARAGDRALGSCYPNCAVSEVDRVKQEYLLAHISLGVGVAGLVGAAAWLLFGPDEEAAPNAVRLTDDLELYAGPTTHLVGRF